MSDSSDPETQDVTLVGDISKYDEIIDILRKDNNELMSKVSQLRVVSDSVERQLQEKDESESISDADLMLLAKERRLKSELEVITAQDPVVEPTNDSVCQLIIDDEYDKVLSNLHSQTKFMEKKKAELEQNIEKLNVQISRDQDIAAAIHDKIEQLRAQFEKQSSVETQEEDEINMLKDQIKKARVTVNELTEQMEDFLSEHFPAPSDEADEQQDLVPLNDIIQAVSEAYVESPNECYVGVSERWWSAHVEMLLRYDILVRHRQQPNKVRLEFYDT